MADKATDHYVNGQGAAPTPANMASDRTGVRPTAATEGASNISLGSSPGLRLRRSSTSFTAVTRSSIRNGSPSGSFRRRSSNLSDYSQEARDLLNPTSMATPEALHDEPASSGWESLPLAFALLPAVGGLFVQGGGAFVTDLMLLALGAVFLHWSVTQPWAWYHSAQQIREDHQAHHDVAVDSDSDIEELDEDDKHYDEDSPARPLSPEALADVPEEEEREQAKDADDAKGKGTASPAPVPKKPAPPPETSAATAHQKKKLEHRQTERRKFQARQNAALRELYRHEALALLSCFAAPVLGAYLLHTIRGQLTRPSEGLISSYNLTIFILAAEIRPLRHLIQLVEARTVHLQRLVHTNPYRDEEERYRARRAEEEKVQNQTLQDLVQRLDSLEGREAPVPSSPLGAALPLSSSSPPSLPSDKRERDKLLRDVRAQLQPELDMLARALRRTHKQQTLLEGQVTAKLRSTDQRLNDTMSLAAATVRLQQRQHASAVGNLAAAFWAAALWTNEWVLVILLYVPRQTATLAAKLAHLLLFVLGDHSSSSSSNESVSSTKKNGHPVKEEKDGKTTTHRTASPDAAASWSNLSAGTDVPLSRKVDSSLVTGRAYRSVSQR